MKILKNANFSVKLKYYKILSFNMLKNFCQTKVTVYTFNNLKIEKTFSYGENMLVF